MIRSETGKKKEPTYTHDVEGGAKKKKRLSLKCQVSSVVSRGENNDVGSGFSPSIESEYYHGTSEYLAIPATLLVWTSTCEVQNEVTLPSSCFMLCLVPRASCLLLLTSHLLPSYVELH